MNKDGEKVKEQWQYLVTTIAELYELYKEEYSDDRIKLSTFKTLCPDVVLCKSEMPHNVYTCIYHENINLLLQSMNNMGMPANHRDLMEHVACDIANEDCMYGKCALCNQKAGVHSLTDYVEENL